MVLMACLPTHATWMPYGAVAISQTSTLVQCAWNCKECHGNLLLQIKGAVLRQWGQRMSLKAASRRALRHHPATLEIGATLKRGAS